MHFIEVNTDENTKKEQDIQNENRNPTSNNMLKVNNRNTRAKCDICSKLTTKTPERRHHGGVLLLVKLHAIYSP